MAYVLILDNSQVSETSHLFSHAIKVEVCSEDGTVYDSRFNCPTCALRPDGRWGD